MNKKVNTLLFVLGATLFNIVLTLLILGVFLLVYFKFIMVLLPNVNPVLILGLFFIAALVITFFAYRFVLKLIMKKVQIEEYFDPIFVRRNIKNIRD